MFYLVFNVISRWLMRKVMHKLSFVIIYNKSMHFLCFSRIPLYWRSVECAITLVTYNHCTYSAPSNIFWKSPFFKKCLMYTAQYWMQPEFVAAKRSGVSMCDHNATGCTLTAQPCDKSSMLNFVISQKPCNNLEKKFRESLRISSISI